MKKWFLLCFAILFIIPFYRSSHVPVKLLPVVGNKYNLERLLKSSQSNLYQFGKGMRTEMIMEDAVPAAPEASSAKSTGEYSQTNVQVAGIDESDIVKTDGEFIYQIRDTNEVVISRAYPADRMEVLSRIAPEEMYLHEIYVDNNTLVILGQQQVMHKFRHYHYSPGVLLAIQYDITDRSQPRELRRIEAEGGYVSSRKIESRVYLVTNKWLSDINLPEATSVICKDTVSGKENTYTKGLDEIYYFPGTRHENYIIITAFDTNQTAVSPVTETYLGSGNNVYMSHKNLYIAADEWNVGILDWNTGSTETTVHKFAVDGLRITYQGSGKVPGNIVNQFSMDEYDGHFRIATTVRKNEMSSGVYILNRDMKVVGKVEGIAPREQIYSARFLGKKGYLVTFEIVDPLFVLDLSDHHNPRILGELKIPGFSNYLHPLDENTILGLGRDTEITENPWGLGFRQKGIKLAIFDVSDVSNPKEKFVEIIGDANTHSDALYNHKAIMFRNDIMAFPIIHYAYDSGKNGYTGAVVYRISRDDGFKQVGSISHGSMENYSTHIKRVLSIKDYIYTISDSYLQAHKLPGMQESGSLRIYK